MLKVKKIEFLKACPYCGSKSELREHWGDCSKRPSWYEVECTNQDCGRCQDTAHEAVEAWNHRASDVSALIADVRALVDTSKLVLDHYDPQFKDHKIWKHLQTAIAAVERHLEEK